MVDLLLKNGLIIDPSQGMHTQGSVAVKDGLIASVGDAAAADEPAMVYDLEGKIVVPGLIDIHCHPGEGLSWLGVPADEIGLESGVTLLCDGGTAGASNFETLRRFIIDPAKTDILCFLNLANTGLVSIPEIWCEQNIDLAAGLDVMEANRDVIKGVKVRAIEPLAEGVGIKAIEMAKGLATRAGMPLMVHVGETRSRVPPDKMDDFSRATVSMMETGDILSHYLTWEPGGMILPDGTVYPELEAAQKRGVVLDSCHGLNHFSFPIARLAIEMGFIPTVISSDMATIVRPAAQSLAVVMSKFLNMGLSLDQVIEMTTVNPAKALGEEDKRGSLKPGMMKPGMRADITILELREGNYVFCDGTGGNRMNGTLLLEPEMVFRRGVAMPAFSGYHIPPVYAI
ncbi:MAG: amidohydrolase/deacetylase family metallohydrolase [Deltaproteobacteria bacterium]|nr:amidohydrolase/deacetylase family metallohydrolase [Deltaproteobacteria bacterium]